MKIKLSQSKPSDFFEQIVRYGFFPEHIPTCFITENFYKNLTVLEQQLLANKLNAPTNPTTITLYKNELARRRLSIPNPEDFLRFTIHLIENWKELKPFLVSDHSLSPVTDLNEHNIYLTNEFINSSLLRDAMQINSSFRENLRNCIQAALGRSYQLKVDIANCYDSIYTHSVTWAMCGKEKAKSMLRNKNTRDATYDMADKLDEYMRRQNDNQTAGIPVGPFTSRIFSEIILVAIDKELHKKNFVFRRYVDDYKFYFYSEVDAISSIPQIAQILGGFELSINSHKTEINRFPYEMIPAMRWEIENIYCKNKSVFDVLNLASQLYANGTKGAFKYALKFLKNKKPTQKDHLKELVSLLFGILFVEPACSKYIIDYLAANLNENELTDLLRESVNTQLKHCLTNGLQQETLSMLDIGRLYDILIATDSIVEILKGDNDLAIIMILDLVDHWYRSSRIEGEDRNTINKEMEELKKRLAGEPFSGPRWLLLLEIEIHKLLNGEGLSNNISDPFFKLLVKQGCSFFERYKPPNASST